MEKNRAGFKIGVQEIFAGLVLVVIIIVAVSNWDYIYSVLSKKEQFEVWIKSYGSWGFLIFVLIQIFQVVVFVIPGEVVYFVGGYLYGTLLSSVLSILGITLGSLVCFGIARVLGQPIVEKIISAEQMEKLKAKLNTPQASITLFMIFLIPGLPGKDALAYVAGLTPIKLVNFLIVTLIARSPWIIVSSLWGANLGQGDYKTLIIIAVIAAIVFLLGVLKGEALVKYISEKMKIFKSK